MFDKILAVSCLMMVVAFMGIVVVYVAELDLALVAIMVLLIAAYDLWTTFHQNGNGPQTGDDG